MGRNVEVISRFPVKCLTVEHFEDFCEMGAAKSGGIMPLDGAICWVKPILGTETAARGAKFGGAATKNGRRGVFLRFSAECLTVEHGEGDWWGIL